MKSAACVNLLALAMLVTSFGGSVAARSPSRSGHVSQAPQIKGALHGAPHSLSSVVRDNRGPAYPSSGRSHLHQAAWQTYGRFQHTALRGHSMRHRGYSGGAGIQCVTFARADSGIELAGNANTWWNHAEGIYQRGSVPEAGSVLNFRANGAMRMGHVAVVNQIVNGRTVIIDHANWGGPGAVRGGVSRNISVVDVSPSNDWSAVRVGLGHSGEYGSIYPTYGFIYNRPEGGTQMASADNSPTAIPAMNPAPRDLRPRDQVYDEVAEAPDSPAPYAMHHGWHRRHYSFSVSTRHATHHHGS